MLVSFSDKTARIVMGTDSYFVYACQMCGSLVIDRTVHAAWHLAEASRIDDYITQTIRKVNG